jgi:copper transport protein
VGAGGAFFLAWFVRAASLRIAPAVVRGAILIGLLGCVLAVGYQGLDALGATLRSYWTRTVWAAGLGTSFGVTAVAAAVALCAALASLTMPRGRRVLATAALAGAGVALAASGHASAAGPFWLTRTAVFVHAVAVAYWIGALVPLLALLRERNAPVRGILQAWSAGAAISVAALALTGGALAFVQVPTLAGLVETGYGRILLAKLAVVAVLLALAGANRFWLTPSFGRSGRRAEARLMTSTAAELALAAIVLGLVGLWRFTPPPRASMEAPAPAARAHIHTERGMPT